MLPERPVLCSPPCCWQQSTGTVSKTCTLCFFCTHAFCWIALRSDCQTTRMQSFSQAERACYRKWNRKSRLAITSGLNLRRPEVLRTLRHYLPTSHLRSPGGEKRRDVQGKEVTGPLSIRSTSEVTELLPKQHWEWWGCRAHMGFPDPVDTTLNWTERN